LPDGDFSDGVAKFKFCNTFFFVLMIHFDATFFLYNRTIMLNNYCRSFEKKHVILQKKFESFKH